MSLRFEIKLEKFGLKKFLKKWFLYSFYSKVCKLTESFIHSFQNVQLCAWNLQPANIKKTFLPNNDAKKFCKVCLQKWHQCQHILTLKNTADCCIFAYSHLPKSQGGGNKRGGGTKVVKSMNVEEEMIGRLEEI